MTDLTLKICLPGIPSDFDHGAGKSNFQSASIGGGR